MIKTITSSTNPLVQKVVKLHQNKYRDIFGEFIAEGPRVIGTLVKANHKPVVVFVTESLVNEALSYTTENNIVVVSLLVMQKMSATHSPCGMLATFAIPAAQPLTELSPGIVFVEVQNPGNAGTLIRTAVAMNKKTAVFVDSVDPWNPKVVQASAGAIGMISIFITTWDTLREHKKALPLCAMVVSGGQKAENATLQNSLLVIGNEGAGLSHEKTEQCDQKITLSMPGNFESLNASIAGSIALYLSIINQ